MSPEKKRSWLFDEPAAQSEHVTEDNATPRQGSTLPGTEIGCRRFLPLVTFHCGCNPCMAGRLTSDLMVAATIDLCWVVLADRCDGIAGGDLPHRHHGLLPA